MNDLLTLLITQAGGEAGPSCAQTLFPFALMLFIFYFILIRPQQKQERERQDMLRRLKTGDTVITSGGLIGKIHSVKDHEIMIVIADKVRVRVAREDVDLYSTSSTPTEPKGSSK